MKTISLKIRKLSPALYYCGIAHLTIFIFLLFIMQIDHRQLLGINLWIKPAKFAISIAIYCFTWPLILQYLPFHTIKKQFINFTIFALSFEMLCIVSQAARGQLSHFNLHGTYNIIVFSLMGIIISIQTLFALYIGFLFFKLKAEEISSSVLWGIRLGIIVSSIFAFEGGLMGSRLSHTVGATDGSPGLPLLNWSSIAGDLRIAHFFGLHALQILPLFAAYVSPKNSGAVLAFSISYFLLASALFYNALLGKPPL